MSLLLSCQAISRTYGAAPLFEQLSIGLFEGDRVGLVGPNGNGKSTLLRILAGTEVPDSGTRAVRRLLRLGYVPQDPTFPPGQRIEDILTAALGEDLLDADDRHTRVSLTLAKVGFADAQQPAATLSGGWAKRLAIACALVRAPDLLLMDEPTNHLDVAGILWLQKLLRSEALAFLVVSHYRYFLENVANRIIELNRCYATGVLDTRGNYSAFLEKKDEALRGQEKYQETLANRVRREVEWLQHGPKARTRKSGARIHGAARLQDELATVTRRAGTRAVRIEFNASDRRTKRLLVAEQIAKRFDTRPLIEGLSLILSPGMRLGILGPNGSGKTTLLRMLAGDVAVDSGQRPESAETACGDRACRCTILTGLLAIPWSSCSITVRPISHVLRREPPRAQDGRLVCRAHRFLELRAGAAFHAPLAFSPRRVAHRCAIDDAQIGIRRGLALAPRRRAGGALGYAGVVGDVENR